MNKKPVQPVLALIILPAFLSFLFSCRNLADDECYKNEAWRLKEEIKTESLVKKTLALYEPDDTANPVQAGNIDLFFTPEGSPDSDIPFIEVSYYFEITEYAEYYDVSKNDSVYKITRKDLPEAYFTINFTDGLVHYSDYDLMQTIIPGEETEFINNFSRTTEIIRQQGNKNSCSINLKEYSIPMKFENGYGFLPLNLLRLFLFNFFSAYFIYNFQDVFIDFPDAYTNPSYSQKMTNKKESWSKAFAAFSYNYLCLALDMHYGRKEYLGVKKFDDWFSATGIKEELMSTNIETAEKALFKVIYQDIADGHTYLNHASPLMGLKYDSRRNEELLINDNTIDIETSPSWSQRRIIALELDEMYKKEINSCYYPKYNNPMDIYISPKNKTIFLYHTEFLVSSWDYTYYKTHLSPDSIGEIWRLPFFKTTGPDGELNEPEGKTLNQIIEEIKGNQDICYGISGFPETFELTCAANYIIKKLNEDGEDKDWAIKNVVLDLTMSPGGEEACCKCLTSWFTGSSDFGYHNKASGTKTYHSTVYDIDFDGNFNTPYDFTIDPDDNITNLRRYLITSRFSFSAANIFEWQMRKKDNIHILGQKPDGGSCVVIFISTLSGTVFATSSDFQICSLMNGSFVDVDEGTDVDITISTDEFGKKVYDRENFCKEFINKSSN